MPPPANLAGLFNILPPKAKPQPPPSTTPENPLLTWNPSSGTPPPGSTTVPPRPTVPWRPSGTPPSSTPATSTGDLKKLDQTIKQFDLSIKQVDESRRQLYQALKGVSEAIDKRTQAVVAEAYKRGNPDGLQGLKKQLDLLTKQFNDLRAQLGR